jgi:hypothetical protein
MNRLFILLHMPQEMDKKLPLLDEQPEEDPDEWQTFPSISMEIRRTSTKEA